MQKKHDNVVTMKIADYIIYYYKCDYKSIPYIYIVCV